jgi:CPA2 family monovalent cation:H+ antiporter-2
MRDAFAVLFFVSVGMLLDPAAILSQPLPVLGTVLAILIGKGVFAFAIVRMFGYPISTAGMVAVSLAQIGEFSFILATLGVNLAVLPAEARDLILAGSIITIILNPLLFQLFTRLEARFEAGGGTEMVEEDVWATPVAFDLADHVILVGYGRVGSRAAKRLVEAGVPIVVVERLPDRIEPLRKEGFRVLLGNADRPEVLSAAGIKQARAVLVAIPNGFEAGNVVALAREMNPDVEVIARAHFDAEVEHLKEQGAQIVLMAENELAQRMAELALDGYFGLPEEGVTIQAPASALPEPAAPPNELGDGADRVPSLAPPGGEEPPAGAERTPAPA